MPDGAQDVVLEDLSSGGRLITADGRTLPLQEGEADRRRPGAASGAEPDTHLAERVGMRPNTFLQNIARARRFLADCLRKRGIDVAMEMS
jgi:hypothetical protein